MEVLNTGGVLVCHVPYLWECFFSLGLTVYEG